MVKFQNNTTMENFLKYVKENNIKTRELESHNKEKKVWQISDKYGNVWNVVFNGVVDEYTIYNVPQYGEKPFRVDLISAGNKVVICEAEKNGRHIKADRLLKQFSQLALMVNCHVQFNFLKL